MMPTIVPPAEPFAVACGCSSYLNFSGLLGSACPSCRQLYEPVDVAAPSPERLAEMRARFSSLAPKSAGAAPSGGGSSAGHVDDAGSGTATTDESLPTEPGAEKDPSRPLVTRRTLRDFRPRVTAWATIADDAAAQLVNVARDVDQLYTIGPRPRAPLAWGSCDLPTGWEHDDRGHYVEGQLTVYRFRRTDGRRFEIHRAASWFGAAELTPEQGRLALQVLAELIADRWDRGHVLSTPSTTGRHLVQRSIGFDREWPVLSADVQDLIRDTSGQGRIELLHRGDELPALVEYDARWSYAALGWGLGAGNPSYDHVNEFAGQQRGRYRVVGTVPTGWTGPGVIGQMEDGGRWRWPREPGEPFDGWVDGSELSIALEWGWAPTIKERLLFPSYNGKGPLDYWREKLIKLRTTVADRVAVGALDDQIAALVTAAVRSIILHTIGAFQGRTHKMTRVTSDVDTIPDAAVDTWRTEGDQHLWTEGTGQAWPEMAHPEWSAAIWARARARLLDAPSPVKGQRVGMLHVPPGQLVACRTDAIYLTVDPRWTDDGAVGRYRLKTTTAGPMPAPRTQDELLRLKGNDR